MARETAILCAAFLLSLSIAAGAESPDYVRVDREHARNIELGRAALARGRVDEAKRYLLEAGNTPGSPQLNSFGPDLSLAQKLLDKGEREVVIEYLNLCANFWDMRQGTLQRWIEIIAAGGKPSLSPTARPPPPVTEPRRGPAPVLPAATRPDAVPTTSFRVTGVSFSGNATGAAGLCPMEFDHLAVLSVEGSGTITYQFVYGDGTLSRVRRQHTQRETHLVNSRIFDETFSGWVYVHISEPNEFISAPYRFGVTCLTPEALRALEAQRGRAPKVAAIKPGATPTQQAAPAPTRDTTAKAPSPDFRVTNVTLDAQPAQFQGDCPVEIKFSGSIAVVGNGTVHYRFVRSDGASAAPLSLSFESSGSRNVATTWRLGSAGASLSGWQSLEILEPVKLASKPANFSVRCSGP